MTQLAYFSLAATVTAGNPTGLVVPVSSTSGLATSMSVIASGVNTTISSIGTGTITVGSTSNITNGLSLTIGTWFTAVVGAQGATGATGPTGPTGATGAQGTSGIPASTGTANQSGQQFIPSSTVSQPFLASNPSRRQFWVTNNSTNERVSLSLGGTAVDGTGIVLYPNQSFTCQTFYGAVNCIASNNYGTSVSISYAEV